MSSDMNETVNEQNVVDEITLKSINEQIISQSKKTNELIKWYSGIILAFVGGIILTFLIVIMAMTVKILQYSSHTSDIIGSSYNDCYDYDYRYIQTDDKPNIYPEEISNVDIFD